MELNMSHKTFNPIIKGYYLPGLPHPLLVPEKNAGYQRLRNSFEKIKQEISTSGADVIVIYSTLWASVLGHQVLGRKTSEWVHVDEDFHDLGSIPYKIEGDPALAKSLCDSGTKRGLHMKFVDYYGFPIDTGSVSILKMINPDNKIPTVVLSSNIYADRAETTVLGKATRDALIAQNKKAIFIVVSALSNRLHQEIVPFENDKIHSLKDQEWNLKILEFFSEGRLEDLSQLSRQIHKEARVKKANNYKPLWWLSSAMGNHNRYKGEVYAYEPVCGAGCAIVSLTPSEFAARDLEFDEDNPDFYRGERNVLADDSGTNDSGSAKGYGTLDEGRPFSYTTEYDPTNETHHEDAMTEDSDV